ncbi:hypothetical protein L6164_004587 [Bauhinia variegata]|uniref:Uncharacterized protein n=1 Tax=Bauhinia variegata TaxID=167791 RepID=A0ACB9Q4E9_BAUVA|nr:hypothetical protein L6164_004587 [Bauhinia variegata]
MKTTLSLFLIAVQILILFASSATEARPLLVLESGNSCGSYTKTGFGFGGKTRTPPPPPRHSPGPSPKLKSSSMLTPAPATSQQYQYSLFEDSPPNPYLVSA